MICQRLFANFAKKERRHNRLSKSDALLLYAAGAIGVLRALAGIRRLRRLRLALARIRPIWVVGRVVGRLATHILRRCVGLIRRLVGLLGW